ncbi:unnamed protein product [Penicillium manginii]
MSSSILHERILPALPYEPAYVQPGESQLFHITAEQVTYDHRRQVRVQLTAFGNQALRGLCHYPCQRMYWREESMAEVGGCYLFDLGPG